MVFSSTIFLLCFLPIFLITYYLADKRYKNIVILVFSILFYSWGAPKFIFVILGTTFVDFHLVKWMDQAHSLVKRRLILALSVSMNLGLLFYFKYSNFFIENVNSLLSIFGDKNIEWTKLVLPIGISFYTFETITYVVDVYRKIHKPLKNFWDYQLYIILFPKLIAGPIIRYHDLADQISDRSHNDTIDNKLTGLFRFIIGLSKKVLIANVMGAEADRVFAMDVNSMNSSVAWIGILAYTFQIYFDFSGYSDMAIGIGRMIGFKFPENFNNPYVSHNISEFWRRWHISLGNWMKNYLYIPLGGNKVSHKSRLFFNLWFVFLLSGLWHGAAWTFVAWGAFHGLFLILDRLFLIKILDKVGKWPSIIFTFIVTMVGWVIFRSDTLDFAFKYITNLFAFDFGIIGYFDREFYTILIIAVFFSFITAFKPGKTMETKVLYQDYPNRRYFIMAGLCLVLLIISVADISSSGFNPFIYFRF
ncbi:MAG TPA: MBOAT family O-acyltransferase [Bacteroidales bacterium]|nr:MBOAT family O-acyltransferase [Bacteroidales bacterium]